VLSGPAVRPGWQYFLMYHRHLYTHTPALTALTCLTPHPLASLAATAALLRLLATLPCLRALDLSKVPILHATDTPARRPLPTKVCVCVCVCVCVSHCVCMPMSPHQGVCVVCHIVCVCLCLPTKVCVLSVCYIVFVCLCGLHGRSFSHLNCVPPPIRTCPISATCTVLPHYPAPGQSPHLHHPASDHHLTALSRPCCCAAPQASIIPQLSCLSPLSSPPLSSSSFL